MLVNLLLHVIRYAEQKLGLLGFRESLFKAIEKDPHQIRYLR